MEKINSTPHSLDDVGTWLDKMGERGLYNSNSARVKRSAIETFRTILGSDEPATAEYLQHKLDDIAKRWAIKNDAKPATTQTYSSRVATALEDFFRYLNDPAGFKPRANQPKGTSEKKGKSAKKKKPATSAAPEASVTPPSSPPPSSTEIRRFPLGAGRDLAFILPNDGIAMAEVMKFVCHLATYAKDFDPVSPKTAEVFALARREG